MQFLIRYKIHFRETFKLALPVSIGQLGHILLGLVDTMMVGRVGTDYLAASALINSIFFLIMIWGIGMSLAITPLVAIAIGSGKGDDTGVILRQGLIVNMIFSLLLFGMSYIASDYIYLLNQPSAVVEFGSSYMKIISFSIIPFMLFQSYKQFVEGLGETKSPMYVILVSNIINAFANYVLIFGAFGLPELRLDGAGYATLLTRVFMSLLMMFFVLNSARYRKYDPSLRFRGINIPVIRKIISIGLPTGSQYFFEIGAFSFAAIMIGWMGTLELAAHQIAISLAAMTYMIILGIGSAATIRVGNAFGAGDRSGIRDAGNSALIMAASFMGLCGVGFIFFRFYFPLIFTSDPHVIKAAGDLLIIAAFFQISDGVQATGLGILRGLTDVKVPMFMGFFAYWVISIPAAMLLGLYFDYGLYGIWVGLLIGLTAAAISFTLRFRRKLKTI
ncbi:MAG: MATE family efflux transporter [Ignavibacteriales bacterium]|nr:MATE family efflux transporter [Ignavibacteriales bacterium]MCF8315371.1 MATE family efflux transporter [Ignavibacteriales bacterium]MCF8436737.1 MATE family efflux transporter [Ignavibacteriales bacterium]